MAKPKSQGLAFFIDDVVSFTTLFLDEGDERRKYHLDNGIDLSTRGKVKAQVRENGEIKYAIEVQGKDDYLEFYDHELVVITRNKKK